MAKAIAMKVEAEAERTILRKVIARGDNPESWRECPCGWFFQGSRCPDQKCKLWKKANGKKTVKLYVHGSKESGYDAGERLGLEGDALRNFSYWNGEITFDAEVNMETGDVTLLTVDGHKIIRD